MIDSGLDQLLTSLAPGEHAPSGQFVYHVSDRSWWWSAGLYRIYGFEPGEVVPSSELITRHRHPDDPEPTPQSLPLDALTSGEAFCSQHRIMDARGRERTVLTVGRVVVGPAGDAEEVRGYVVDLTEANRVSAQDEVDAAVAGVTEHRAAIEQAKGMLMALRGVPDDAAFRLLRDYSQQHNVKLRDLAELLVVALRRVEGPPTPTELDTLVSRVSAVARDGGLTPQR